MAEKGHGFSVFANYFGSDGFAQLPSTTPRRSDLLVRNKLRRPKSRAIMDLRNLAGRIVVEVSNRSRPHGGVNTRHGGGLGHFVKVHLVRFKGLRNRQTLATPTVERVAVRAASSITRPGSWHFLVNSKTQDLPTCTDSWPSAGSSTVTMRSMAFPFAQQSLFLCLPPGVFPERLHAGVP